MYLNLGVVSAGHLGVLRTGAGDAAEWDMANPFGKMSNTVMLQAVLWFRRGF